MQRFNDKWRTLEGYRGLVSHVFGENLEVCVREDHQARNRRWRVLVYSQEVSRHDTLQEARIEVLKRLIELSKDSSRP